MLSVTCVELPFHSDYKMQTILFLSSPKVYHSYCPCPWNVTGKHKTFSGKKM